jgi:3-dehydroquinate synthase
MRTISVPGSLGPSRVLVGASLKDLPSLLPDTLTVLVTDQNVLNLYGRLFPPCPVLVTGQGESSKTPGSARALYKGLLDLGADRSSFLVGVGGGIVTDLAGFTAATYMRGIPFAFVPTTLLAQVDASVGGKNGVNLDGYKNIVGTFCQPAFVLCDTSLLKTLPPKETACGLAEIVKHAAIADNGMFAYLEQHAERALALDPEVITHLVLRSVEIKAGVVGRDARESGERKLLNFGHTYGHALEKVAGVSHGEAVAAGMAAAARLSVRRGLLHPEDAERLARLLVRLGLPVEVPADRNQVLEAMAKDKKRHKDTLDYVLLSGIGKAVTAPVALDELGNAVRPE